MLSFWRDRQPVKLGRSTLEKHGIFYLEGAISIDDAGYVTIESDENRELVSRISSTKLRTQKHVFLLPKHVKWVRDYILNFKKFIPKVDTSGSQSLSHMNSIKRTALDEAWSKGCTKFDIDTITRRQDELFADYSRTARLAEKYLHEQKDEKSGWQSFYDKEIFHERDLSGSSHRDPTDPRFSHCARACEKRWKASGLIRDLSTDFVQPTQPEPDIVLGFRVSTANDRNRNHHDDFPEVKRNFSLPMLRRLSTHHKLHTMPLITAPLPDLSAQDYATIDCLMSFPFAIVEIKSAKVGDAEKEHCLSQAANAASTSLALFERLCLLAAQRSMENSTVPPVLTFTCVGPYMRLWLAYSVPNPVVKPTKVMVPIWEGCVTKVWDVIQAHRIYDLTLRWSTGTLRQRISNLISQIETTFNDQGDPFDESGDSHSETDDVPTSTGISIFITPHKSSGNRRKPGRSITTPQTDEHRPRDRYLEIQTSGRRVQSARPATRSQDESDSESLPVSPSPALPRKIKPKTKPESQRLSSRVGRQRRSVSPATDLMREMEKLEIGPVNSRTRHGDRYASEDYEPRYDEYDSGLGCDDGDENEKEYGRVNVNHSAAATALRRSPRIRGNVIYTP